MKNSKVKLNRVQKNAKAGNGAGISPSKSLIRLLATILVAISLLMAIQVAFATEPMTAADIEPISGDLSEVTSFGFTTPTGIPLSDIGERIDELVANYMHEFTPGAAIAVVSNGEIIFSRGYGYADLQRQIPVDPAVTVFEYGSIAKLFVYTSVMQLVEQGRLDLDADIHNYLPQDLARELNFEKTFTMRDLLNHSAGFGEFFFNTFIDSAEVENRITLREGLLMSRPAQIFEPGTFSSYSNFGSALAAYVVTYVSGQDFSDYERENILNIIEMDNTRNQPEWIGDSTFIQNKAVGYAPDGSGGFTAMPWAYIPIYPAGALRGTAEDLARFAIALTPAMGEGSPLFGSRDTLDLMLSSSSADPSVLRGMLHGFMSYDGRYTTIGHGGGTAGFNTEFAIVPSERFGVVVLSNAVGAIDFNGKVLDLLIGSSRYDVVTPEGDLPNAAAVAGNYVALRRHEGNVLEPLNFILGTNATVTAIDENTITIELMGINITYQQVAPYVFRAISSEAHARMVYELKFIMENGRPVRICSGGFMDMTPETFAQSTTALILNGGALGVSILFFLIMSIIVFIGFLRRKGRDISAFTHLSNGLLFGGTLIGVNFVIAIARIATLAPFLPTSMVMVHVWINYVLVALTIIALIISLVLSAKTEIQTRRKVLYVISIVFLAVQIFVLWNWNFFVIM